MPRDVNAQLEKIRAELIKDQIAADQLQEKVNSIPAGETLSSQFEGEPEPSQDNVTPRPPLTISDRESRLVSNCLLYAANDPAGLPGHNLSILVYKMWVHLEIMGAKIVVKG